MNFPAILNAILSRTHLSRDEAGEVMRAIMSGELTSAQISGLLVALRAKGETVEEIAGFAHTMREFATPIPATRRPLVDTCGTGGDGHGTFNISTTAAFVVAGAGVAVAKHGNRSASSKCGSADVLEALGVHIDAKPEAVARAIDEIGIGFLFARNLHGAMKHVAPVRAELKVRTVFNVLGPLTNPAGACGQVMGVFDANWAVKLAEVLANLGTRRAFVVAGADNLDEIALHGETLVAEVSAAGVDTYTVVPEDFGMERAPLSALLGGEADVNAGILRDVLGGSTGPQRDIILLNAAPALVAGGAAGDLSEGVAVARQSIDSGAAMAKLDALIQFSK